MSASQDHSVAATGAATVIFLIDESLAMIAPVAGGAGTKAEVVATAVNSVLNQLAGEPSIQVALVGYRDADGGQAEASPRWAGPLAGRTFVESGELPAAALGVENRVRRIPVGRGPAREETIRFPIWYMPAPAGAAPFDAAAACCRQLLETGSPGKASARPPLILHVCSELPPAGVLQSEAYRAVAAGALWCHLQLGASTRVPPTLYPSTDAHLASDELREWFSASCVLPDGLAAPLRAAHVPVQPGGRALVYQAAIADLIRFLSLAKAYAAAPDETLASAPAAAAISAPSVPGPALWDVRDAPPPSAATRVYDRALVILLLDRSQSHPDGSAWSRRQQQANQLLASLAHRAGGDTDAALITYGGDGIEIGFDGQLAGNETVADVDLGAGALRWEEHVEKVSNGIGGLVEVKRSQPIFIDRAPSAAADFPAGAFDAIGRLAESNRREHKTDSLLPIALHLTGGAFPPESVRPAAGELLLYHWITPEQAQPTLAYPADSSQIEDPRTLALWRITSPLAGAPRIAERRRGIDPAARGFVVGARFDLFLESLNEIVPPKTPPDPSPSDSQPPAWEPSEKTEP